MQSINIIREVIHLLHIVDTVQNDPSWQEMTGVVFIDGNDYKWVASTYESFECKRD